jgi:8-oxo-dGTP pyrophosphatase MutT (NUDIX family)
MFTRIARRVIHESKWLNLYQDDVRFPDGKVLRDYHFVHFDHEFVACLARDKAGRYALVQQPRYPTNSMEWEIPGGGVESGEDVLTAARREMREETGWESEDHRLIYSFYPVNGNSNQKFNIVTCRATRQVAEWDPTEITSMRWCDLEALRQMLATNEITDGYTLVGLLMVMNGISNTGADAAPR